MSISLAVKYRPKTFDDVSEQGSVKAILENQISTNTIKHGYLFCGGAGTGKTTCARIFANEINKGQGEPIELDAASNNSVEDIRRLTEQAQTKSLDSEFKVFIIDECVTGDTEILTDSGWKRIDSITPDDKVAQYTKDKKIQFVENWEYVHKHYSGDMYKVSFRNGKKSVLMSPHHVQPVRMKQSGKIKENYIKDAKFAQTGEIIVGGISDVKDTHLSDLDRLYIACQADGYCKDSPSGNFWELHLTIDAKKKRAIELLESCGISYRIYGDLDTECSIRFYYDFPKSKKFCDYFSHTMGYIKATQFIDEILLWDGSTKSGYPGYYSCTDKSNVDFVSCILAQCGYSGNQGVEISHNPNHNDIHFINWYYTDARPAQSVSKEVVENWEGDIYCVKVPSQMILLRAEGFTFVSGNCHSLSNQAWQAMLKTLEEPPASSIFIFCTTNPEKIPNTILSRVQRYNFQRISQKGIVSRLKLIIECENQDNVQPFEKHTEKPDNWIEYDIASLEYIAKIADGGMRDAITLMDKCLSYSKELSVANVEEALGLVDYQLMYDLTMKAKQADVPSVIEIINGVYASGVDLKLFVKNYFEFVLDFNVFLVTNSLDATKIPKTFESKIKTLGGYFTIDSANELLDFLVDLQGKIKWEQAPKAVILAGFMLYIGSAK